MQYHIQTTPIWDAFRADCDCPMCKIFDTAQAKQVGQYLNEAVMEPSARVEVNRYGFCTEHMRQLFVGKNKLGLALQLRTRTDTVRNTLRQPHTYKQAIALADKLDETMDTCVICRYLDELMERYAFTVAQMFANEPEFPKVFVACHGLCMPHFTLLLRHAKGAGKNIESYLNELYFLQNRSLDRTGTSLDRFAQMFDYRNAGSAAKPDPDTVPAAIRRLKGSIL